jgi:hypothetical protein
MARFISECSPGGVTGPGRHRFRREALDLLEAQIGNRGSNAGIRAPAVGKRLLQAGATAPRSKARGFTVGFLG